MERWKGELHWTLIKMPCTQIIRYTYTICIAEKQCFVCQTITTKKEESYGNKTYFWPRLFKFNQNIWLKTTKAHHHCRWVKKTIKCTFELCAVVAINVYCVLIGLYFRQCWWWWLDIEIESSRLRRPHTYARTLEIVSNRVIHDCIMLKLPKIVVLFD